VAVVSKRRASVDLPGVVTWGWYSIVEGAAPAIGGNRAGLVPRGPESAFWAAWWTVDPRRDPSADPDAYGFVDGAKAAFMAEIEADRCIREQKSQRAYVLAICPSFARSAYWEGAPRRRSEAKDFEAIAAKWRAEHRVADNAQPSEVKAAWRAWVRGAHPDRGGDHADMERERLRYEAALAVAQAAKTRASMALQRRAVEAGERPFDPSAEDAATIKRAISIATDVRSSMEEIASYLGAVPSLAGLCHFAAHGLAAALREEGVHAVEASTGGHSFVHVLLHQSTEPLLLDVTASQIGMAAVYVRRPGQKRRSTHEPKVKGKKARDAIMGVAAMDVLDPPSRWWALRGRVLIEAMRMAGTRLSEGGRRRLQSEPMAVAFGGAA
jgi:hypothetical protein